MVKFHLKLPFFGINIDQKPTQLILKQGETILISEWRWKKFGWIKKLVQIDKNGDVKITTI